MNDVVGVRFKRAGPVYYFDPAGLELLVGDSVVVQTSRGLVMGKVVIAPGQVLASQITEPLKPVLRRAEEDDLRQAEELQGREREALAECESMIAQLNLPMKLLCAEYTLDGSRLTFHFSAEGRVDFRELVRELTATFKTRVDLRQVGPRDEAKLMGGFGRCGRPLCCTAYLSNFNTVSIRMAKEQDLPLNPTKISGLCGRLLCCLGHEVELYRAAKERLPKVGQQVTTPFGNARVAGVNILKETVLVELESKATVELPADQMGKSEETAPKREQRKHK